MARKVKVKHRKFRFTEGRRKFQESLRVRESEMKRELEGWKKAESGGVRAGR